jgi:hypothetical protein
MLNPWKQVRLLRGIITSLQSLVKSLQTVIETQGKLIVTQRRQIELLTTERTTVTASAPKAKYLN